MSFGIPLHDDHPVLRPYPVAGQRQNPWSVTEAHGALIFLKGADVALVRAYPGQGAENQVLYHAQPCPVWAIG